MSDLAAYRDDIRRSSGAGYAVLLVNGLAWLLIGGLLLSQHFPQRYVALALIFMGAVTTPLSFGLQSLLRLPPPADDNPLTPLVIQLSLVQILCLPAVIVVYKLAPHYVPLALAAIVGGHFVPYAWLHNTRAYAVLAAAVSLGAFVLALVLQERSAAPICLATGAWMLIAVPFLIRHGR